MRSKIITYRGLIVVAFILIVLIKLNYIFFGIFQLHAFFQNMLEPHSKTIMENALPGLEMKKNGEVFFESPRGIFNGFLALVFQINKQEPASLFAVQFTPMEQSHSRVMAEIDEGEIVSKAKEEKEKGEKESESGQGEEEATSQYKKSLAQKIEEAGEKSFEDKYEDNIELDTREAKVLIYHSHTTESYVPTSGEAFSENPKKSIVEVGKQIKESLESAGLQTIHNTEVHDLPTRHESYVRSLKTVENILEDNPQIEIVIDLHRDGIRREVTTASVDGKEYGKILFLVGSRDNYPGWKENYEFASMLNNQLKELKPELSRGIKTRQYSYNQEVHPRSVLIEIGGHENSLEEALNTVPYLVKSIKKTYLALEEKN